jgi:HEAT repeat protein
MNPTPDPYPAPVNPLLQLGELTRGMSRLDYLALGLAPEHVPDLIRMAQDDALHWADSESKEVWAPVHAWRALGQLRAEAAIGPLLGLLQRIDDDDDDWATEELPKVFGQIGPAALLPLEQYAASPWHGLYARIAAGSGLKEIGQQHPAAREAAIAALMRVLENYAQAQRDPTLNAFLISELIDLGATQAAPLIQRAFAADAVDEMVAGDWLEVQKELKPIVPASPKRRHHRRKS